MFKKGYYGNEDLCLAWDRMEVDQVALYTATDLTLTITDEMNGNVVKLFSFKN